MDNDFLYLRKVIQYMRTLPDGSADKHKFFLE